MKRAMLWAVIGIILLLSVALVSAEKNNINLTFVDEDTNSILNPSVTVNGISATVTGGIMDFNTDSSEALVIASLSGYTTKTFNFGFPGDVNILNTVTLLVDTNAQNVDFKQRTETGGTLITDANIVIVDQNTGNIVGASIIGSDSLFNAVLKPIAKDYNFMVTGSAITDFNYTKQELIVNNVINERTQNSLGGFGTVIVSNPGSFTYNNLVAGEQLLIDNFDGSDGDPPNSTKWFIFDDSGGSNVIDILDNDLNIFAFNSQTIAILSDLNFTFDIGDVKEFEYTSVNRPTSSGGSPQWGAGLVVDNNANPITAEIQFSIRRTPTGVLSIISGGVAQDHTELDQSSGEIKLKVRVTRVADTSYKGEFYLNDTNKLYEETTTVAHNIYKASFYARGGATSNTVTGKFDDAIVRILGGNLIFPYTNSFYSANVDFNSSFFARTYKFRLESAESHTLQPYLVDIADGVSTTMHTIQALDITTPIPDLLVKTIKQIAGSVEVESVITDSKGEALQSYLVGDIYSLEFYDLSGSLLFTKQLEATSANIFAYVLDKEIRFSTIPQRSVNIGFSPISGRVFTATPLTQTVNISNGNIARVEVVVTNFNGTADVNVFDTNYTSGIANGFTNIITAGALGGDANYAYIMTVYVHLTDNVVFVGKTTYSLPIGVDYFNLISTGVKADLGCGTICPLLMIISFFFTTIILVSLKIFFGEVVGAGSFTILAVFILGIFTYFAWIPFEAFALITFVGLASLVGIWRGG